jgi:sulfate adenylyltransferase subunit 2
MSHPDLMGLDASKVWDTESAFKHLNALRKANTKGTVERLLHAMKILPAELKPGSLSDEFARPTNQLLLSWALGKARKQCKLVLFVQLFDLPSGQPCLHANDTRGGRYWVPLDLAAEATVKSTHIVTVLNKLRSHFAVELAVFPHAKLVGLLRPIESLNGVELTPAIHQPLLQLENQKRPKNNVGGMTPHLRHLEAESIHIIREAVAEAEKPVLLYSIGKDSSALLHLIRKAFYPGPPPLPMIHVDTRWKFQEMYLFRDHVAKVSGMDLLLHTNPEAIARDINPFDHGSDTYINLTKVEGLKQAIDYHKFDVLFGGARRDEEKSRAKERIFSFRTTSHRWDPKQQRPELWNLYNTKKQKGESIRVFPLSNWTELDIWQYIYLENIAVVPLYFAKKRPVVERNGTLLMIDDERFRLKPGEEIQEKIIRFRSLGCYPLTGAIESTATNVHEIIMELLNARKSERQGRVVDHESPHSLEKKKQEGHF